MNDVMIDLMIIISCYVFVFLLGISIIGFLLRGFFLAWLQVKTSAGKKILVMIRGVVINYSKPGKIIGTTVRFKGTGKDDNKVVILKPDCVYKFASVNCINYDEQTGSLLTTDYEGLKDRDPNNPSNMDALLKRCLYQPQIYDNKEKIILAILVIILLGVGFVVYLQYMSYELMRNLATIAPVV